MGAQLEDEAAGAPSMSTGDIPIDLEPTRRSDGYIPPEDPSRTNVEAGDYSRMSSGSRISLVTITIMLVIFIALSPRPFFTSLFVLLSLLPAFPIIHFIRTKFDDRSIGWTYLLNQLLLGAIPLVLFTIIAEWLLTFGIGFLIFRKELREVEIAMDTPPTVDEDGKRHDLLANVLEHVALWKMILFFLLIAFVTAGFIEEVAKWMLARRYRKVDQENAELDADSGARIGCKGILAIACMGALGFAACENMGYILVGALSVRKGFSFRLVGITLLRGLLAYPLHIGTQFFVAVSAAQWYVFKDKSNVMLALFVAVLFHGTFDGVALLGMLLIGGNIIPFWVGYLIPVFDFMLVGLLLLLCRSRYKALLVRESLVLASEPV